MFNVAFKVHEIFANSRIKLTKLYNFLKKVYKLSQSALKVHTFAYKVHKFVEPCTLKIYKILFEKFPNLWNFALKVSTFVQSCK